jgi:spore coat polysaccharide biosynthesis protein SpsF
VIGLILQARMSSKRFPGKVLKLIEGKPLIMHVIDQCRLAHSEGPIIVCTSTESSDNAIVEFCNSQNVDVYRGSLNDVYNRYLGCIEQFDLSAFGRICCDSPGISSDLVRLAVQTFKEKEQVDLVSNVCVRSFPVGQSVEIVNAETFFSKQFRLSSGFSEEHVTQTFYKDSARYNIFNIKNINVSDSVNWAVDEPRDLEKVSQLLQLNFSYDPSSISIDKWVN